MASLVNCKTCDKSVSEEAKVCPHCGQPSPKPSGCFVATAVYGNYDHPVVYDLRQFRDNTLASHKIGNAFIDWYYSKGPRMARWVDQTRVRKFIVLYLVIKPLHILVKLFRLDRRKVNSK